METLTDLTHGLMHRELHALVGLSRAERMTVRQPRPLIELYKFGVRDSPWELLVN